MIEDDTIKLLRECNAGIKMGVTSIDEVLEKVTDEELKHLLQESKTHHEKLGDKTHAVLLDYHDQGKEPNPMAKGMSWMKTNIKLMVDDEVNGAAADLITDGCNMGVKSLARYLNQYKAAEEKVKGIAKELIAIEEKLAVDIRKFL